MNLQSKRRCVVCSSYQDKCIFEDGYTELEECKTCHHLFLPYVYDCNCGAHDELASEKGQRPE